MKTKLRVVIQKDEPQIYGLPKDNVVECLAKETGENSRNLYLLHKPEDNGQYALHIGTGTKMRPADIVNIASVDGLVIDYIQKDVSGTIKLPDGKENPSVTYDGKTRRLELLL